MRQMRLLHPPQGPHAYLRRALSFLVAIEDASLAQGVASLLWQTFLEKKIEALVNTMDKVKKVAFESRDFVGHGRVTSRDNDR